MPRPLPWATAPCSRFPLMHGRRPTQLVNVRSASVHYLPVVVCALGTISMNQLNAIISELYRDLFTDSWPALCCLLAPPCGAAPAVSYHQLTCVSRPALLRSACVACRDWLTPFYLCLIPLRSNALCRLRLKRTDARDELLKWNRLTLSTCAFIRSVDKKLLPL